MFLINCTIFQRHLCYYGTRANHSKQLGTFSDMAVMMTGCCAVLCCAARCWINKRECVKCNRYIQAHHSICIFCGKMPLNDRHIQPNRIVQTPRHGKITNICIYILTKEKQTKTTHTHYTRNDKEMAQVQEYQNNNRMFGMNLLIARATYV